jgi:hypothetical protein
MTLAFTRFVGHTMSHLCVPFMHGHRVPVDQIKLQLRTLLDDCSDKRAQRVSYRISGALTAEELWQIRSELHQCISQLHSQTEAARRINSLLPTFAGWVPARQLVKI